MNPLAGLSRLRPPHRRGVRALEVYPALARWKAFAIRLTLLRRAGTEKALPEFGMVAASRLLDYVSTSVVTVCV